MNKLPCVALGFDLGIRASNPAAVVAVECDEEGQWHWRAHSLLCPNESLWPDRYQRVDWLYSVIDSIIEQTMPDLIGYEVPFVGPDPQVAIIFGHLGGIIRACGLRRGIPVFAFSPKEIKAGFAGNGGADKDAMIYAAQALFNIDLDYYAAIRLGISKTQHDMRSHLADAGGTAYVTAVNWLYHQEEQALD
jgi:Holliday junction resolvasome RuvABC endonuclease subunit